MNIPPTLRAIAVAVALPAIAGCRISDASAEVEFTQLPTGVKLDPAGSSLALGSMPLAIVDAPGGKRAVALLSGWREQGIQVIDLPTHTVVQTHTQAAAFFGLAFSPDGKTLAVSGGNQDVVYRYAWDGDTAAFRDSVILRVKARPRAAGKSYPAGVAF